MKKLFKAVALATVMCMLLSTAAFAEEAKLPADIENDTVTVVDVITAANEQVVLLIVDSEVESLAAVTDAQIQFIDQKQADAEGIASFGDVKVKGVDPTVDVYVGYAGSNGPKLIGENINLAGVKNITIAEVENPIVTAYGDNGNTRGFAAAITVNIPEGLEVSKMIWGFKLKGNDSDRFYSDPDDFDVSQFENVEGAVQFAAAFELGNSVDKLEVDGVSAIFLTADGREHYTDDADYANRKDRKNTTVE